MRKRMGRNPKYKSPAHEVAALKKQLKHTDGALSFEVDVHIDLKQRYDEAQSVISLMNGKLVTRDKKIEALLKNRKDTEQLEMNLEICQEAKRKADTMANDFIGRHADLKRGIRHFMEDAIPNAVPTNGDSEIDADWLVACTGWIKTRLVSEETATAKLKEFATMVHNCHSDNRCVACDRQAVTILEGE